MANAGILLRAHNEWYSLSSGEKAFQGSKTSISCQQYPTFTPCIRPIVIIFYDPQVHPTNSYIIFRPTITSDQQL